MGRPFGLSALPRRVHASFFALGREPGGHRDEPLAHVLQAHHPTGQEGSME